MRISKDLREFIELFNAKGVEYSLADLLWVGGATHALPPTSISWCGLILQMLSL